MTISEGIIIIIRSLEYLWIIYRIMNRNLPLVVEKNWFYMVMTNMFEKMKMCTRTFCPKRVPYLSRALVVGKYPTNSRTNNLSCAKIIFHPNIMYMYM